VDRNNDLKILVMYCLVGGGYVSIVRFIDVLEELLEAQKKVVSELKELQETSPEEYEKFVRFSIDPAAAIELAMELNEKDPTIANYFLRLIRTLGELQTLLSRLYFTSVEEKERAVNIIKELKDELKKLKELIKKREG